MSELREVSAAIDRGRPVVLRGVAGIGKSALAAHVARQIPGAVAAGALATLHRSPLFVFRRLLGDAVDDRIEVVARRVIAREWPLVLIDDVQWADPASVAVLDRLVGRVSLVLTVRRGDPREPALIEQFSARGAAVVEVGPLDSRSAARLARRHHRQLTDAAIETIVTRAEGNPLLLQHIAPDAADGTDRATSLDPSVALAAMLLPRLRSLEHEPFEAIATLSVLGRAAERELLPVGAEELVRSGLATIDDDGRIALAHPLLGEVVEEQLGTAANGLRRTLAGRVDAMEAAHLLLAAGDRAAARAAALRAADTATGRRDAAEALIVAIECAPAGELDIDLRIEVSTLLTYFGEPHRALDACRLDDSLLDTLPPLDRGRLRYHIGRAAWMVPDPATAARMLDLASGDLAGTGTAEEVLSLASTTVFDTRVALDGAPALERARRAVELSEQVGAGRGFAMARLASVVATTGGESIELFERAAQLGAEEGDDDVRLVVLSSLVLTEWVSGNAGSAARRAREAVASAPSTAADHAVWASVAAYGALISSLLATDREAEHAWWSRFRAQSAMERDRCYLAAGLSVMASDIRDHDLAMAELADVGLDEQLDAQRRVVPWWAAAEAAWSIGDTDEVAALAEHVVAEAGGDYPAGMHLRLLDAYCRVDAGLAPIGDRPNPALPAWMGVPHEWDGLVAWHEQRFDDAAARFALAAEAFASCDVRSAGRARWARGEVLRLAGDTRAADALTNALDWASTYDLRALADRIRRSLRRAGVASPAGGDRPAVAGLSRREFDVMWLVGQGLTTREIGRRLHLSISTVDTFVDSAMRKLGRPTRVAAAAELRDQLGRPA